MCSVHLVRNCKTMELAALKTSEIMLHKKDLTMLPLDTVPRGLEALAKSSIINLQRTRILDYSFKN